MRSKTLLSTCLAVGFASLVAGQGCSSSSSSGGSGGADCTSLCSAAQGGNCTTIKGNCGNFCAALAAVYPAANCTSQYNAYEGCLGTTATVCNQNCTSQENALTNCVTPYCAAHTNDTNCATLAGSF
jgi:hypothetical protein